MTMNLGKQIAGAIVFVAMACVAVPASAWGPNGHAIVADIAEAHLTPVARKQIDQLLAAEGKTSLDQIADWADVYRRTHPETGAWHFVDIPLRAQTYDEDRDCPAGNCIVDKIVAFAKVLGDRSASTTERTQALNFLVHFLGDVHQPLHCEDNGDQGGNAIKVTFYGRPQKLHAIWDSEILERATGLRTMMPGYRIDHGAARAVAQKLNKAIDPNQAARWAPPDMLAHIHDTTVQWATESHLLAQSAYRAMDGNTRLDDPYENQEWPVVQQQLERGGIRLAELLNEIFH